MRLIGKAVGGSNARPIGARVQLGLKHRGGQAKAPHKSARRQANPLDEYAAQMARADIGNRGNLSRGEAARAATGQRR